MHTGNLLGAIQIGVALIAALGVIWFIVGMVFSRAINYKKGVRQYFLGVYLGYAGNFALLTSCYINMLCNQFDGPIPKKFRLVALGNRPEVKGPRYN